VLLVVLWVRSYTFHDIMGKMISSRKVGIHSVTGRLAFCQENFNPSPQLSAADAKLMLGELGKNPLLITMRIKSPRHLELPYGNLVSTVVVPYWLPVLLTGTLAAAPWIRWRFSLRTLLIATTVIAVVLGAIALAY
jgi:hypothetical protein